MSFRSCGLDMRGDMSLAQLKRYLVGVLNTGAAEVPIGVLWVDGNSGSDSNDGKAPDRAKLTIQNALDNVTEGGTVAVFPKLDSSGNIAAYAEHLDIDTVANTTLLGLGDRPRDVLLLDTSDSTDEMIGITKSGTVVKNLHVQLGHANNVEGIVIGACDYVTIEDCLFTKYSTVTYDEGIRIMGPNTNIEHVIRNCFFDTVTLGIVFEDSTTNASDVIIEGCTFRRGVTADITDSADIQVDGVVIRDCDFIEGGTDFIVLDNASTTGVCMGCRFDYATHELDVIALAAGVLCIGNITVAGVSTAHPA